MKHDEKETFFEILHSFHTTMLVTHELSGNLRSRPMAIADVDEDGVIWLVSSETTGKVSEIQHDAKVALVFQDDRTRYASLSGTARVSKDRAKLHSVWREEFQVWFPDGPESPDVCLLEIEPIEAEFWDNRGTKKIAYLYEAVKARLLGRKPALDDEDQYGRVAL